MENKKLDYVAVILEESKEMPITTDMISVSLERIQKKEMCFMSRKLYQYILTYLTRDTVLLDVNSHKKRAIKSS